MRLPPGPRGPDPTSGRGLQEGVRLERRIWRVVKFEIRGAFLLALGKIGAACNGPLVDTPRTRRQPPPVLFSSPMKPRLVSRALTTLSLLPVAARAAEAATPGWHAQTLGQALGYMILFSAVGIVAAIAGYKLFDKCTPGDLHHEIVQNKNVAAAIIAAAVILGVCMIIAAAMLG